MSTRFDLPYGEGFYLKRDFIYLAVRVEGQKFAYATGWTLDEPNLKTKLRAFKVGKIAEAKASVAIEIERAASMEVLFSDYVEHLKRREAEKGDYTTGERTTSYRTEGVVRRHLEPFFGKMKPEDVAGQLMAYRKMRDKSSDSPATINGELRILSATMTRGWKNNKVLRDDLPKEYPYNHDGEAAAARTGTITADQISCITQNAAPHLKVIFLTCVYTGIRPKELRWLRRADVILDGDDPRIEAKNHKTMHRTRKPKVMAIWNDEHLALLKEWEAATNKNFPDCKWFFHYEGEKLGTDGWKKAWDAALRRCGIGKGTIMFYDARRTTSTVMDEQGVAQSDIDKQMGHAPGSKMPARYNQSKAHVKRIRETMKPKAIQAVSVAPTPSNGDWKAQLQDLKETFEAGLIPEDIYRAEVAEVLKRKRNA